jgi:hypothetical protein
MTFKRRTRGERSRRRPKSRKPKKTPTRVRRPSGFDPHALGAPARAASGPRSAAACSARARPQRRRQAASAAAAKAEARASQGLRRGDDGDATAAVTLWTKDVDAVLSKLDACDEVVRAKRLYFKERREQEEKEV